MQTNFDKSLSLVLVNEGGWADDPKDPGGATMKGVTLAVFRRYYGADRTENELRDITYEQLSHIYKTGYWDKCACDAPPAGVDYAVFDAAVNSGPVNASNWFRAAVGAAQDRGIGASTLERVDAQDLQEIINEMLCLRLRFLKGLRTWPCFGTGWGRRIESVRRAALDMIAGTAPRAPVLDYESVRLGDKGPWAEKIQQVLGLQVDGDFGPRTEAALKAWQAENGLEPDGIAGRVTYRVMGLIA